MGRHQPPLEMLAGLPAWQVAEIPRQPFGQDVPDGTDMQCAQRLAALAAAYGDAAPVAVAWIREQAGGPVRVIAAGRGLAGGTDQGQAVLTIAVGARGCPLPAREAASILARMPCWTPLAGVNDVLLADGRDTGAAGRDPGPSLEDGLLSAWLGPFAWLLLAEPADPATVAELAGQAASAQLIAQQNSSPRSRLAARRAAARHDELRQAASSGLWRVHLHAGGATPGEAARIAALVCASSDLRGLPYALVTNPARPGDPDGYGRPGALVPRQTAAAAIGQGAADALLAPGIAAARSRDDDTPRPESPFWASTHLVAALARPPAREVPGLRFTLRPEFDVTCEPEASARDVPADTLRAITAGTVLDWNRVPAGPLSLPLTSLNRHTFVCGATGAGKSQTIRGLLEAAAGAGIPWLVIEPAKAEYRLMAARLPGTEVIRIRPGDLDAPPAGISPLEPAAGHDGTRFPLQTHADLLRALFLAAFQADEPFPQVLSAALAKVYEHAGWDLVTGQPATPGVQPGYPSLEDLQAAAMNVVDEIGYGREVRDNVRGFVTVRIGSLRLGTTGRFLDGAHPLDFARLLDANVVFEIEDTGDDHDKAFLMGTVLIRLIEHLRLRSRAEPPGPVRLRHLTVIEEAHRLLRRPASGAVIGAAAHATEMFADLLAEIRAYGEGLIIAEQIPAKLIPDVIKNTAVKIVHRLPAADDRDSVGATMNLTTAQSGYLVALPPGEAAVHCDGMDYPVLARMPDGTSRETSSPARTVGPEPVIGRRSTTCAQDCRKAPCTLAQIRAAWRTTVTDPRITLWAELAVIAHLTGWTMPRPAAGFGGDLRAMPVRLRDCALSHAVDAAVTARAPAFSVRVSPGPLAAHVTDAMRHSVATSKWLCEREEPEYLAPAYKWAIMHDALKLAYRGTDTGRHPRSGDWERQYGHPIPGDTCARQYGIVSRWYERDQQDRDMLTIIAWGTRTRTVIEHAVGTTRTDEQWNRLLGDLLEAFGSPRWPRNYLRRSLPARQAAQARS